MTIATRRRASIAAAAIVAALGSAVTSAGQLAPRSTRPQVIPPKGLARQVIFKSCTSCQTFAEEFAGSADSIAGIRGPAEDLLKRPSAPQASDLPTSDTLRIQHFRFPVQILTKILCRYIHRHMSQTSGHWVRS